MAVAIEWTQTEKLIIDRLSDGLYHSKDELKYLIDEFTSDGALHFHISNIKKKLNPIREDIRLYRDNGRSLYMHVRIVAITD